MYEELYGFIEVFKKYLEERDTCRMCLSFDISLFSTGEYISASRNALYAEILEKVTRERTKIIEEKTASDTFRELVTKYIKELDDSRYFKKNGEVKTTPFHEDAFVGSDSWAALMNGEPCEKDTALRIVMALKLNEVQANTLLKSVGWFLNVNDERDVVLMALMACGEYRPIVIYHVLEHEREKNKKIKNIYTKKHYELMCE